MATSLSVHVKAVIDPEKEEEFLKALEPTFKNITAEPLNIFAEVYKDPQNPGVFRFVENWNATLDHMMNVQRNKEYYADYRENVVPFLLEPQETQIFARMPGKEWATVRTEFYHVRS